MTDSCSRGVLQSTLDPDNPAVNKQTMLDWLRIHHPMTVVASNAKKGEVAQLVREKQPELFKNTGANSQAVTDLKHDRYPPLEQLRVTSPNSFTASDQVGKRSASQDLVSPYPPKRAVIETELKSAGQKSGLPKVSKKRKSPKETKPLVITRQPKSKDTPSEGPPPFCFPSPKSASISDVSNDDEKRELKALKKVCFTPMVHQDLLSNPSKTPIGPSFKVEKNGLRAAGHPRTSKRGSVPIDMKPPRKKESDTQSHPVDISEDADLIQFSDTEVFEVGNLVIGRDIPVIDMQEHPASSSNKPKTGVHIFQEEQRREDLVRSMSERLECVENSLGIIEKKISTNPLQDLQQQQIKGTIDQHSTLLDDARKEVKTLQEKMQKLELETKDLQRDLELAHSMINNHVKVIRKLITGADNNSADESSLDSENDQSDQSLSEEDASVCQ